MDREGEDAWFGFGGKGVEAVGFFLFWNSRGLTGLACLFFECKMKYYVTFGVFVGSKIYISEDTRKTKRSRATFFFGCFLWARNVQHR